MMRPGPSAGDVPRLGKIVDAILRIADMDFNPDLKPSSQRDEIDAIMVGINSMAAELQDTYETLDRRVAERTHMLELARDQMETLAYTDPLTQLANRSALTREINNAISTMAVNETTPVVMLLDLDSFKSINDTYGHDMGDQVLRRLAERLRDSVRSADVIARLGGDEFALLVNVDKHTAMDLARRIVQAMNEVMVIDGVHLSPSSSLGFTWLRIDDATEQQVLLEADTAMYIAKRSATESVIEFEPYMLHERMQRAAMVTDLHSALKNNEFIPYYQSLVSLQDEALNGAEILVRWQREGHGLVGPGEFLEVAEESGLIWYLTEHLLYRALDDLARWRSLGLVDEKFKIHLNVTSRELHRLGFPDLIREALRQHDLPGTVLALEITENRLMSGDSLHQYALLALKNMGVDVYIDDFGIGYSSIGYLAQLPVAGVKIDKSLVDGISSDAKKRRFLAAISGLINACELQCVVEGIETTAQAAELLAIGFTDGQGFLYDRPVGEADFTLMLRSRA
ncbi:bifunctional diguanylate cyclase/phosphodiesterase [Paeniglutamicibacter antarcticus]|uniref:Diguanylate cyclase (GGDEF)-like protein n=1 Tax=Paeniglutamicibacter antarcticus TaxID=494023 RepID=A0ABP9TRH6_9MICC